MVEWTNKIKKYAYAIHFNHYLYSLIKLSTQIFVMNFYLNNN